MTKKSESQAVNTEVIKQHFETAIKNKGLNSFELCMEILKKFLNA